MAHREDSVEEQDPSALASPLAPPHGYPEPDSPVAEELSTLARHKETILWGAVILLLVVLAVVAAFLLM